MGGSNAENVPDFDVRGPLHLAERFARSARLPRSVATAAGLHADAEAAEPMACPLVARQRGTGDKRRMEDVVMAQTEALPLMTAEGGLTRYFQEIRRYRMLEPAEEFTLAKRWREHGD